VVEPNSFFPKKKIEQKNSIVKKNEIVKIDDDDYLEPLDIDLAETVVRQVETDADKEFMQVNVSKKVAQEVLVVNVAHCCSHEARKSPRTKVEKKVARFPWPEVAKETCPSSRQKGSAGEGDCFQIPYTQKIYTRETQIQ
jgi:hypothetical protein